MFTPHHTKHFSIPPPNFKFQEITLYQTVAGDLKQRRTYQTMVEDINIFPWQILSGNIKQ